MVFSPLLVQRLTVGLHKGTTLHHEPQNCFHSPIEMLCTMNPPSTGSHVSEVPRGLYSSGV